MDKASRLIRWKEMTNVLEGDKYVLQTAGLAKYLQHINRHFGPATMRYAVSLSIEDEQKNRPSPKALNNTNKTPITPANSLPEGG